MAAGDLIIFEEALEEALENWAAADELFCAVLDTTTTITQGDTAPKLAHANYSEMAAVGNYSAGGQSLGTWANFVSHLAKVTKLDSTVNPLWSAHASGESDARWMLIYNGTQADDPAFAYLDLGSDKDMSAGDLGATWDAAGIATLTLP